MLHEVFISHSAVDKVIADRVADTLEQGGVKCWVAPRDIRPGDTWGGSILKAIQSSRLMVIVFSTNSNESQQVMREVELAVQKNVVVLPFRVENVEPSNDMKYFLSATHWLDALSTDLNTHLAHLLTSTRSILGKTSDSEPSLSDIHSSSSAHKKSVTRPADDIEADSLNEVEPKSVNYIEPNSLLSSDSALWSLDRGAEDNAQSERRRTRRIEPQIGKASAKEPPSEAAHILSSDSANALLGNESSELPDSDAAESAATVATVDQLHREQTNLDSDISSEEPLDSESEQKAEVVAQEQSLELQTGASADRKRSHTQEINSNLGTIGLGVIACGLIAIGIWFYTTQVGSGGNQESIAVSETIQEDEAVVHALEEQAGTSADSQTAEISISSIDKSNTDTIATELTPIKQQRASEENKATVDQQASGLNSGNAAPADENSVVVGQASSDLPQDQVGPSGISETDKLAVVDAPTNVDIESKGLVVTEVVDPKPVAVKPGVEAPVVEAPVVKAPVVKAPVVEAPVVEAPVVEAPVIRTIQEIELAAAQGDVLAQQELGLRYEKGQGVTQSDIEAVKWYKLAAAQGNSDAQNSLGIMYELGVGVMQSDAAAEKWYNLASEQGNLEAQRYLNEMLLRKSSK